MSAYIEFGGTTIYLRVNPYDVSWSYNLNTVTEETYGGKVTQILSVNIEALTVSGSCGNGGRAELIRMMNAFRKLILWQNDSKQTAKFVFTEMGYSFRVYGSKFSFGEKVETVDFPYSFTFVVQEDETGIASGISMKSEIDRMQEGVGYRSNEYNTPGKAASEDQWGNWDSTSSSGPKQSVAGGKAMTMT